MTYRTHDLSSLSTGETYDHTQCADDMKDGDLFVCNKGKTIGFLSKAWPIALFGETGSLHTITPGHEEEIMGEYPGLLDSAFALMKELGIDLPAADESTAKKDDPDKEYW